MEITILKILLPLMFALFFLPLFLRFFIGRIILIVVKRRYVSHLKDDTLSDERDTMALNSVLKILLKKLSYPFIQKYSFKEDLFSLILTVQNCYSQQDSDELKFTFSIAELIKCYFLLMSDLNNILNNTVWLNKIKKSRVSTLKKINRISGYYSFLFNKIPFLKLLRKGRITGKLVRIILIPILGLPSIIISIFFSIISLFFTEIIWKYYYAVLIIKFCYYSMILYGEKASLLKQKLHHISISEIKEMAEQVEELINPHKNQFRSPYFEKSFVAYQSILEQYGISSEKDINFDGIQYRFNRKRRVFKKLLEIPINAVKGYNPFYENKVSHRDQLLNLIKEIASVYSDKDDIFDDLRIAELFEILYMVSLISYNKLLMGSIILDNLSVDFILKAKNLNDDLFNEVLEHSLPGYKQYYKSFKLFRKSRVLYRAARSANPVGLVLSLSGPIAYEGMKSQFRDYIFRKTGRFTIYCFESNALNRKKLFFIR